MATQVDQKLGFKTDYRLMHVKSIAECSSRSILQYLRPSLSYHLPLGPLNCPHLRGPLRQVLLYTFPRPGVGVTAHTGSAIPFNVCTSGDSRRAGNDRVKSGNFGHHVNFDSDLV